MYSFLLIFEKSRALKGGEDSADLSTFRSYPLRLRVKKVDTHLKKGRKKRKRGGMLLPIREFKCVLS
jgi:hypothetical protein